MAATPSAAASQVAVVAGPTLGCVGETGFEPACEPDEPDEGAAAAGQRVA
jgi:hypothetical protein